MQCDMCMCVISASDAQTTPGLTTGASQVLLFGMMPPIAKMDNTLSTLKAAKHISLSSNNIERVTGYSDAELAFVH
jgi:hypothetical protein